MMGLAANSSVLPWQQSSGPLWLGKGVAMGLPNVCIASSFEDDSAVGNPPIYFKRLFYTKDISLTHTPAPPSPTLVTPKCKSHLYGIGKLA